MGVYIYSNERIPSESTVGYRPFKSDLKDYSGNGYDFSVKNWSVSYANNMVTITSRLRTADNTAVMTNYAGDFTILGYTKSAWGSNNYFMFLYNPSDNWMSAAFWIPSNSVATMAYVYWNNVGWTGVDYTQNVGTNIHLLAAVKTSSAKILYLDGVEVARDTSNINAVGSVSGQIAMWLWRHASWTWTAVWGSLILEKRAWTEAEILNFYNTTKANYGIS